MICSYPSCQKEQVAKGYCNTHYTRLRKNGSVATLRPWRRDRDMSRVLASISLLYESGMTIREVATELKINTNLVTTTLIDLNIDRRSAGSYSHNKAEKNGQWKGNEVKKSPLHSWIRSRLIKPDSCQDCNKKTSYLDLANISQEYKRDLSDWEWLCRSCHMQKDGRAKALHMNHLKSIGRNS